MEHYHVIVDRRQVVAGIRIGFALLTVLAIVVQMLTSIGQGSFDPTRFFAFFTIQSNVFGVFVFLVLAARWRSERSAALDLLRGASVVYLSVTFVVVIWLLSGADLQVAIPWVDFVLHKLFPVVVVLDWLVDPPSTRLTLRDGLTWLAFPLVWVVVTLVRGGLDDWYPYPFLDPANGGSSSVALYVVAILVGFVLISAITIWLGNAMRDRGRPLDAVT